MVIVFPLRTKSNGCLLRCDAYYCRMTMTPAGGFRYEAATVLGGSYGREAMSSCLSL